MQPDGLLQEFELDPTPIWPAEDGRLEPIFLAEPLWLGFEEDEPSGAPLPAAFGEFAQLDPERGAEDPDEAPGAPRRHASAISLLGSLAVHLLTLAVLIGWTSAPAEVSDAIPMHLVMEAAPSAPEVAPPDPSPAENAGDPAKADSGAATPAAPPEPPPPAPVAAEVPPPKPIPPPPAPKPAAPPEPHPAVAAAAPPEPASPEAPVPGSDTGRGDYLDYLVTLTRGHFDILPLAFLAGRRGRTTLSVLVFADGTIGSIAVKRSSGYPDIDAKIEQMVTAVGHFPPPPDSFRKPSVELDFNLTFPDALQQ